jgi:hypothetical protein
MSGQKLRITTFYPLGVFIVPKGLILKNPLAQGNFRAVKKVKALTATTSGEQHTSPFRARYVDWKLWFYRY